MVGRRPRTRKNVSRRVVCIRSPPTGIQREVQKMGFSDEMVEKVWQKGSVVGGNEPREWRKDSCTAWIQRSAYGNVNSDYGWNIDHIKPVSKGGSDDLSNLQPLHWENNANKQDGRADCPVRSDGTRNV